MLERSDIIVAQAFEPTDYDWRIGVIGGEAFYACRYFMAKAHWQIVKHDGDGKFQEGGFRTLAVDEAPADVVRTAVRAANLIGDGLYGVDLKQTAQGLRVIEINDNPSIDRDVEDAVLGNELYRRIMAEFLRRLESRGRPNRAGR